MIDADQIDEAKRVDLATIVRERGIRLAGRSSEMCGPCPACGGNDRFSVNLKKQVFNCRGCGAKGAGSIDLVMFLDGCDFSLAVETLTGVQPNPKSRVVCQPAIPAQQKPPSRVIGAGTFMRSYVPISYTVGGILPSGYLYGLTAKQGSGKTAFEIAAALAVAFGREDILECPVERGRVAYVTIENPVDFKMKLAVNCYVHNISYDEIEPRVAIIDGRDMPEQIFDGLRLDAEASGDFQLVCFDTFQAGFAAAGGVEFNDNAAVLKYVISLRPLTTLPGLPSVLVAFHPTKNAGETELIPYGGGSTYNEVDGNLTLWKEATIKLHHNRLRGPEFEPRFFRIEQLSCPAIVDKQGRQILLPVLRPTSEKDVEERARVSRNTKLELLRAMLAEPKGTQRDWAMKINLSVSTVNQKLKILEGEKLVKKILDAWFLTPNGENLAKS